MSDADTIERRGSLSAEIEECRKNYRAAYAAKFEVCERKSDAATARLFGACIPAIFSSDKLHLAMALGLWIRCVSACQAALLLLERGMAPEAQTLIRSAFEFLFFAAATAKDPDVLESMMHGDTYAKYEQARCMLKEGIKTSHLTQSEIDRLNEVIAEGVGKKQISAFDAAEKVGMSYYYATVYKGMSLVGAHATAASTDAVFQEDERGISPVFGPSDDKLAFCIGLIDKCLEEGSKHFDPILQPAG
jgi:hypothetical protein